MNVRITIEGQSQEYRADWAAIPSRGDRVRFEILQGTNTYTVNDVRWVCGQNEKLDEVELHLG